MRRFIQDDGNLAHRDILERSLAALLVRQKSNKSEPLRIHPSNRECAGKCGRSRYRFDYCVRRLKTHVPDKPRAWVRNSRRASVAHENDMLAPFAASDDFLRFFQ